MSEVTRSAKPKRPALRRLLRLPIPSASTLCWADDANQLFVGTEEGRLIGVQTTLGSREIRRGPGRVLGIGVDGDRVVGLDAGGRWWMLRDGASVRGGPHRFLSPDGNPAKVDVVVHGDDVWMTGYAKEGRTAWHLEAGTSKLKVIVPEQTVARPHAAHHIELLRLLPSGALESCLPTQGQRFQHAQSHPATLAPSGRHLMVLDEDEVRVLPHGGVAWRAAVKGASGGAVSADGTRAVVTVGAHGVVLLRNTGDRADVDTGGVTKAVAISTRGDRVAVASSDVSIWRWR